MMTLLARLPRKHFQSVMADPPWDFRSYAASKNPESDRNVTRHYKTMKLPEIKALPLSNYCAPDCHLWLWSTGPHLPQALDVMAAWGFRYSGIGFVWFKLKRSFDAQPSMLSPAEFDLHLGLGFTTRKNVEFCLLGRRGNAKRIAKNIREVIMAPVREHSRKPDEARERIERYCAGPHLELFARSERKGWTCRGDQVGRFR